MGWFLSKEAHYGGVRLYIPARGHLALLRSMNKPVTVVEPSGVVKKMGGERLLPDVVAEHHVLTLAHRRCAPETVPEPLRLELGDRCDSAEVVSSAESVLGLYPGYVVERRVGGVVTEPPEVVMCDRTVCCARKLLGYPVGEISTIRPCRSSCFLCSSPFSIQLDRPARAKVKAPSQWHAVDCVRSGDASVVYLSSAESDYVCLIFRRRVTCATLVTRRIRAETAFAFLQRRIQLVPRVMQLLFAALERLHAGGVVHNDAKLDNFVVVCDKDGHPRRAVCLDLGMSTSADWSAYHLAGFISEASGIDMDWSAASQKCDVTQLCVSAVVSLGTRAPGFCASLARLAEPHRILGCSTTPVYFRRGVCTAFATAATALGVMRTQVLPLGSTA